MSLKRKSMFGKLRKTFRNTERIILRDYLALERTTLANERTLFSYIRTALYLLLGGIAFLRLKDFRDLRWASYILFGISAALILYGLIRFFIMRKKLDKFYQTMEKQKRGKERIEGVVETESTDSE